MSTNYGIERTTGVGTFEDDYNNDSADFAHKVIKIITPVAIGDSVSGGSTGSFIAQVGYAGGSITNLRWSINDWATTNTLTGSLVISLAVSAGTYTLKVRDNTDTDIESETIVVVRTIPDYGEKYLLQFDQEVEHPTAGSAHEIKIKIYQDGYTGSVTDICADGDNPATLKYNSSSDDVFKAIKGSTLEINAFANDTTNFTEIAYAGDREYYVEYLIDDVLEWNGFIEPQFYVQPITKTNYITTLVARCGLGLLKERPLLTRGGERFNDQSYTLQQFIELCCKEIGINSNKYKVYLPLYPDGKVITGVASEPTTEHVFIDMDGFYRGDEVPSFYDALEEVLKPLTCRIFKAAGYWWVRYSQITQTSVEHHYNDSGTWLTTTSLLYKDADTVGEEEDLIMVNQDHMQEYIAPHTLIKHTFLPNHDVNLVPDQSFLGQFNSFGTNGVPVSSTAAKDWTGEVTGNFLMERETSLVGIDGPSMQIIAAGDQTNDTDAIRYAKHEPVPLEINSSETGTLKIYIKGVIQVTGDPADLNGPDDVDDTDNEVDINFMVLCAGHALSSNNSWYEIDMTETDLDDMLYRHVVAMRTDSIKEFEIKINTPSIPWVTQTNPAVQIRLFESCYYGVITEGVSVIIENLTVEFVPDNYLLLESGITTENSTTTYKEKKKEFKTNWGYHPVDAHASILKNLYHTSAGPVSEWDQLLQGGGPFSLDDIIMEKLNEQYGSTKRLITGSFLGDHSMNFEVKISSKYYIVESSETNLLNNVSRLRLIEQASPPPWP